MAYQVDFLVCDRTFASLDAVAARLLGAWAGYGIRFLTLWRTDVVADYLACACPKVRPAPIWPLYRPCVGPVLAPV